MDTVEKFIWNDKASLYRNNSKFYSINIDIHITFKYMKYIESE